ncbi:putative DNA-binding transcriptional regulator YafY [Sporolactobacillus spathodeae]|uniref:DNA-binding transcriptional regulator YafY n=1 Tax=Sporolactobacillus spathodeae TaxID=1465502 RepID=A0ABS2QA20_9BACL|nr:putative DNA-binding transcriptional regulator YafY [Sporolactobacillus spathodeae]
MRSGDVIVIIYQAKDGQFSKRRVRIISVGTAYIKAYCYTRRQVRTFTIDRIYSSQRVVA